MVEREPDHWLYRLTPEEWLIAATNELRRAEDALLRKQQRAGVAQARRAAGMALNGLLARRHDESSYGRSFMEHLEAMSLDSTVPIGMRQASALLIGAPLQTDVIPLGKGYTSLARSAAEIVEWVRGRLAELDLLQAGVATQQLGVMGDIVDVGRPQPADGDHDDLHGAILVGHEH